jgi:RNA polymerase sigma factor (sigma-70 family)
MMDGAWVEQTPIRLQLPFRTCKYIHRQTNFVVPMLENPLYFSERRRRIRAPEQKAYEQSKPTAAGCRACTSNRSCTFRAVVMASMLGPFLFAQLATGFAHLPLRRLQIDTSMRISATATVTMKKPTKVNAASRPRGKPISAQRLEPRTQSSEDERRRAISAMNRAKVESALLGVDAQMLEMLSNQFIPLDTERRKGRPASVFGAMGYDTMMQYRERSQVWDLVRQNVDLSASEAELSVIAPYIVSPSSAVSEAHGRSGTKDLSAPSSKRQPSKIKGELSQASKFDVDLPVIVSKLASRSRKRVVKNLPKSKKDRDMALTDNEDAPADSGKLLPTLRSKAQPNSIDFGQYHRTRLLTPDEEYSLGTKIQFMDQCEQVHEGLAIAMGRLPSMKEWAEACGYTDEDPSFLATEADELLRPVGSDTMFDDIDPNMFVGNGLAHQSGPGRGRGRVKETPPHELKDFYDDSEYRVQLKAYIKSKRDGSVPRPRRSELRPINRGTPTDFVEVLMAAREAKKRMVQSNMRLVVSIARKYSNVGVSLQDLVQEGSLGLSRAAEKFEPKKGFKFSTYASWWIQQAVYRSIAYHSRTIRLPVHIHSLLSRVRKVKQALQGELGRAPTNEEIAEKLGMSRQKFNKILQLTKRSISLEAPKYQSNPKDLGHESDDLLGDTMSSTNVVEDDATPEKCVDHGLFHEDLKEMMKILNEDEHRVICARYGLQDGLTRTVTTVANQMRQSKAWVRSQECRALRKLRRPWYEKKLREHQNALAS